MVKGTMKLHGRPTPTRALHKNGRRLYVKMTFAIVKDTNEEVLGSVAVARDVTERIDESAQGPAGLEVISLELAGANDS
jgi:PAS domain S-box-containing protein